MTTAADRARAERAAQGLPTPAARIGDDVVDARVAAAYRTTATLLTSAVAVSSPVSAVRVEGTATGAAGGSGGLTSSTSVRSTHEKTRPVAAGRVQNNAG